MDITSLHRVGDPSPFPVAEGVKWDCYTTIRTGRLTMVLVAPNISQEVALEFVTAPILEVGYYQSLSLQAVAVSVMHGAGAGPGRQEWVLACPLNDEPDALNYWASSNQGSLERPRLDVVLVDSETKTIRAARQCVIPNELIEMAMLFMVTHGDYFVANESSKQFMLLGPDVVWGTSRRWKVSDVDTVMAPMYLRPKLAESLQRPLPPQASPGEGAKGGLFNRLLGSRR